MPHLKKIYLTKGQLTYMPNNGSNTEEDMKTYATFELFFSSFWNSCRYDILGYKMFIQNLGRPFLFFFFAYTI